MDHPAVEVDPQILGQDSAPPARSRGDRVAPLVHDRAGGGVVVPHGGALVVLGSDVQDRLCVGGISGLLAFSASDSSTCLN